MDATPFVLLGIIYFGGLVLTLGALSSMVKDSGTSFVGSLIMRTPVRWRGLLMGAIVILWPVTCALFVVAILVIGVPFLAYNSLKELRVKAKR